MRTAAALAFTLLVLTAARCLASVDDETADSSHQSHQPSQAPVHERHQHDDMEMGSQLDREVGVDEHLGERVPADIPLLDEHGRQLRLGTLITKPTLLLPVYYSCPTTCSLMLANLAQAINRVPLQLGDDYRVLAFSFDEEEGPALALHAKNNYSKILKKGLPVEHWTFLTADKEAIRSLTDAVGFRFKRTAEHLFIHPNVLIALAPDGTVIRYLYGPSFLPFDIGMALTEAGKGTPGMSVRKLLTYCFDYDAERQGYVFRSFRLLALGILILLLGFFFFVLRKGRTTT